MKSLSVFAATSYREYINDWITSQESRRGLLSEMCRAMQCQNAHLTRVINEKVHLTPDQGYRLCQFFAFSRIESQYFLKMMEHDRAGDHSFRHSLAEELRGMKQAQEDFSKRFKQQSLGDSEKEKTYYSSWHWIALHYITEIEKYQTSKSISDRLGLPEKFVKESLELLEKYGLVQKNSNQWRLNSGSIHLPKISPMNSVQHGNWRQRAVIKSQEPQTDGLHYTVVQTLSLQDFENVKELLLKTVDQYRKIAQPSSPEELICMNIDFFKA